MKNSTVGDRCRMVCRKCKQVTNHELRGVHRHDEVWRESVSGDIDSWEEHEARLWICQGCDAASLEIVMAEYHDEVPTTLGIHPPSGGREEKDFRLLNPDLRGVYKEVIGAFNNGLVVLCAIGLRALLEGVCVAMGINDGVAYGLERKLKKLEADKHLPPGIVRGLHGLKVIGDNAAHQFERRTLTELESAIIITEDLLNFLFELRYRMEPFGKLWDEELRARDERSAQGETGKKAEEGAAQSGDTAGGA